MHYAVLVGMSHHFDELQDEALHQGPGQFFTQHVIVFQGVHLFHHPGMGGKAATNVGLQAELGVGGLDKGNFSDV